MHKQEWCKIRPIIYPLYSLHFLTICANFYFRLCLHHCHRISTPSLIEYSDRISHRPPNEVDTMMTTYPAAANLSVNYCTSGDASAIVTVCGINNVCSFILLFFISASYCSSLSPSSLFCLNAFLSLLLCSLCRHPLLNIDIHFVIMAGPNRNQQWQQRSLDRMILPFPFRCRRRLHCCLCCCTRKNLSHLIRYSPSIAAAHILLGLSDRSRHVPLTPEPESYFRLRIR